MNELVISGNEDVGDLWQFISDSLGDEILDEIEVTRKVRPSDGLACEPLTSAVILTLAPLGAAAVLRLVEKWMEFNRQREQLEIVLRGFSVSDEAGKAAERIALKHAQISVKYGPPSLPQRKA